MHNLSIIEECYQRFIREWPLLLHDGIQTIDIKSLNRMNLIQFHESQSEEEEMLTRYFHVVETREKITLINEEFVVWIVPDPDPKKQLTTVLIALNKHPLPTLECGFHAIGVYNTSSLVLKYLEKLLNEIHENERVIQSYQEAI